MNNKKKMAPIVNLGSSSLLVVFLVLCLVTFATLSLSSAQSNYKFSEKLADRRTEYYTASSKAERVLDTIDQVLAQTYEDSSLPYYSEAEKKLLQLTFDGELKNVELEINFSTEIPSVSYSIEINKKQSLMVTLELLPVSDTNNGFYEIKQWKSGSTAEWNGDNTLKLIQ